MMNRHILIAISLACASAPLAAAPAAEATAMVRVDDLDLTAPHAREQLDARLRMAARRVCDTGVRSVSAAALENRCMSEAVGKAAPQIERAVAEARAGTQVALLTMQAGR